ncbi:MAG: ketopantoate reductase family protein [Candidatus Thorarchaeota archaeon]
MQITIFGAGSIGSLFAGRLAFSGFDSSVIGRPRHIAEIRKSGLRVINGKSQILSHLPAHTHFQPDLIKPDVLFITTKAYDNAQVATILRRQLNPGVPLVLIQNGMGNEAAFIESLPSHPIFRAITTEAAELITPGIVKHVAFGRTSFNGITGDENGFKSEIKTILERSGFQSQIARNIHVTMWRKLLTNATICPLAALLRVPNGLILEKPSNQRIFDALLAEGLRLAQRNVPDADFSQTRQFILKVIKKTADNKCSMLQDIERGRRTEIDFLNGFIAQESERWGLNAPVNAAVTDLVHQLEP